MPSNYKIGRRTAILCVLAIFGLGIATERYRQYTSTNVGDVSLQRTSTDIALAIDGDAFTTWEMPVTLRAGSHQFHATWREFHVDAAINVKRGDKAMMNRVQFTLNNDQLQVEHNSHLIAVVPRPAPEVYSIQAASGEYWHTADGGEITLHRSRDPGDPGDAEPYTIHWLRPNHREAFIQTTDGRYITNATSQLNTLPGLLKLCDGNDWPSVFQIDRIEANEPWRKFAAGRHFVDVVADPKQVRTTLYEVFASPLLLTSTGDSVATKPVPPTPAIPVVQAASSSPSVRKFQGHSNVIRAVVFTPDGRYVVSGSSDATIRFWDINSGQQVGIIPTNRPVMSLAVSNDGKSLACGMTDGVVKVWNLKPDPVNPQQNERILARDSKGDVLSIAFSPDDTKVAAGGNYEQHTRIWNLLAPDERCKSSSIHGPVTALVWSRSGEHVLLCQEGGRSLRWWPEEFDRALQKKRDPRSGKLLIRSGNAPLVVVGGDIIDAETREIVHSFQHRNSMRSISAQISGKKNLLVTGDVIVNAIHELEPDELVSIWDVETGRPLAVLRDHVGQVGNIAISPNGRFVAYGNGIHEVAYRVQKTTEDYDLRVWQIP